MGIYIHKVSDHSFSRGDGASGPAKSIAFDPTISGLPASVQGALDKTTGNISSLGTVELTATAAHAHAAGSTFLWIGQLVKVTTAIAVGDTIAVGTNVANTDICSILSELNSNVIMGGYPNFKIQWGQTDNAKGIQSVNFPSAFSSIPCVLANIHTPSNDWCFTVHINSVTKTGFTMNKQYINENTHGPAGENVYWIAVGQR